MHACRKPFLFMAVLMFLAGMPPSSALAAEDVDFSCMSYEVRGKTQVSVGYKEYDVVLQNRCPGPVYWAMCIERLDPMTYRILEAHTPSGFIEAEQNIRVNLQMKKGPDSMDFRQRFQEFYVAADYRIDAPPNARCIARQCETAKGDIRRQITANLQAWQAGATALRQQLARQCPESGWGKTEQVEECEAEIRANAQPQLDQLAQKDTELREELLRAGPPGCELHAGDLVP